MWCFIITAISMILNSLLLMMSAAINTINSTDVGDDQFKFPFHPQSNANLTEDEIAFLGTRPGQMLTNRLPQEWSTLCSILRGLECLHAPTKQSVKNALKIVQPVCASCSVNGGNTLRFEDLRQFLQNPTVKNTYAVTIKCHDGGNISLPYPMRADGLKYIHVHNCFIIDSMADYFNDEINLIPDTLLYYAITNSVFYVDSVKFSRMIKNIQYMTKAAKCGPEKDLMIAISRNISFAFSKFVMPTVESMKSEETPVAARTFYRGVSRAAFTCNYTKLIEIDRSIAKNLGSKHDSVLLQNSEFPSLQVFNLSHVLLRELPGKLDDWRLYFPRMKYLDLSHNRISDFKGVLDYGIRSEDHSMGTLDLRYNNITTITLKQLHSLQHHRFVKVDIRNNPFDCNCGMRDFVQFFRHENNLTTDGVVGQYIYLQDLECQRPVTLKGRRIVGLTFNELGCELETTTLLAAPIIILCLIVVILVVFIIIMIKYRKEIVILAFTRLNILLPCQRVEDNAGKNFDAFVSYSQHDSDWVLNTLVPGLERPNGLDPFKLCLHQRDFAVGTAIAENIVNSVEASRHTILVISRKFLESEWCLMEFRTAFHQSLLEKKKHLILVTLEHLAPEELDADLKRCMQTLTYVNINDRLFWDKIIFSLSDKIKIGRDKRFFSNIKRAFLHGYKQNREVNDNDAK
ncbi:toll-like receptor 6 [Ylistrum balloti]|uniref:toll-like receptor 6 n=1 Tax=Ylistrum balloti TaxID=509963 RepID=UPI002905862E|nr:toll-like receptor 6 [Ylistrum balloti]